MARTCCICKVEKPDEEFYRRPDAPGGRQYNCKACSWEREKARRAASPHRTEKLKEYKQKNIEHHRAVAKKRYEENIEEERRKDREFYAANRDRLLEKDKEYRQRPEVKARAAVWLREYRLRNPEKFKSYEKARYDTEVRQEHRKAFGAQRRALLKAARERGRHTPTEWVRLCAQYDCKCLRCGRSDVELTKDHVIPITMDTSSDSIDNLQPLCGRCNKAKNDSYIDYRPAGGVRE